MAAIGYIRQSRRVEDLSLSFDNQKATIERMAKRDGFDEVQILSDMGRSGAAEKTHLRASYNLLLNHIKNNGNGTVIYALSMSRLARSLDELRKIFTLAAEHNVRIVFEKEGELNFSTPIGKLHSTIIGAIYEFELELSKDRARDNVSVRRARGDRFGRIPYGEQDGQSVEAVTSAFKKTHNLNQTAQMLNRAGVQSWSKKPWTPNMVRQLLLRLNVVQRTGAKGAKPKSEYALYRLLRCSCGRIMTPSKSGKFRIYRCSLGSADPNHPKPYSIMEHKILPTIIEEAERFDLLGEKVNVVDDFRKEQELRAKRERIVNLFVDGVITKVDRDKMLVSIDDELAKLEMSVQVVKAPKWDGNPSDVNMWLRFLFAEIRLDSKLQPKAVWHHPERRRPE